MNPLAAVAGQADRLPSISLAQVLATADLQTRVDRKYLIPVTSWHKLAGPLSSFSALDIDGRRQFRYQSNYFDTDDLLAYRLHVTGRRQRWKVRTRTYLDSEQCALEVKTKSGRGETVKERLDYAVADQHTLTPTGLDYVTQRISPSYRLAEVITITYRRSTFVNELAGSRLTVDVGLRFENATGGVTGPPLILVETKAQPGPAAPIDRMLWRLGHRPLSISKYGIGIAILHPTLAANRWNRILRHHFGWTRQSG